MSELTDQDIQETYDAIEQYHKSNPEIAEALCKYREMQRQLLKVQHALYPTRITVSDSTAGGGVIFDYLAQMSTHTSLNRATSWILSLHRYAKEQVWQWIAPVVPLTEEDEVVMEWWHDKRKLAIWFDTEGITYLCTDEQGEMTDGDAGDGKNLYAWLVGGEK